MTQKVDLFFQHAVARLRLDEVGDLPSQIRFLRVELVVFVAEEFVVGDRLVAAVQLNRPAGAVGHPFFDAVVFREPRLVRIVPADGRLERIAVAVLDEP